MTSKIEDAISREATKLVRRHETYATGLSDEFARRKRRSSAPVPRPTVLQPPHWTLSPGFDPYHVRTHRRRIAHSIQRAIRAGAYRPRSSLRYSVPKGDGDSRDVSVFQVADSAVSWLIYKSLLQKNRPRLSARSYAYREDLTAHDALQFIRAEFGRRERLFLAEYDFTKYFDKINHEHIRRTLADEEFLMTETERQITEAFLTTPWAADQGDYSESGGIARDFGVPQGTSISLFLANVAAAPLDRALERLGVGFVRYADDTLVWATDYGQICRAVDELFEASRQMGVELNPDKSKGVRLLVREGTRDSELPPTCSINFVGYRVSLRSLEMKDTAVERVKDHMRQLLFTNLLAEPLKGNQNPKRLGKVDADYYVFILQARRYLYGDLSETDLRRYKAKGVPGIRFKGLMSFYPLIDDTPALASLDGWLASQSWLALRKRGHLLTAQGFASLPPPHGLAISDLAHYRRKSATTGQVFDLTLPSFRRIASIVRLAARQHGPNAIGRLGNPYAY